MVVKKKQLLINCSHDAKLIANFNKVRLDLEAETGLKMSTANVLRYLVHSHLTKKGK